MYKSIAEKVNFVNYPILAKNKRHPTNTGYLINKVPYFLYEHENKIRDVSWYW